MSETERRRDVRRWLRFAAEDLRAARASLEQEGFVPRHVSWLAQQAAEKALKSALVAASVEFPFRHDLDRLRNLLPDGWRTPAEHPDLAELTQWAVEARYPGDWPDTTVEEARRALEQARGVYESVVADLRAHGFVPEPNDGG